MSAKITRILDWDGDESLIVPGTDPAQILADAQEHLDSGEEIHTSLTDVRVQWWRVNPCHPSSCHEGRHTGHWTPTGERRTRGGFQAAQIDLAY